MKIIYRNPGIEYSINSIMSFQRDDSSAYWSDSLFYFYPQIDKEVFQNLSSESKKEYMAEKLTTIYEDIRKDIDNKIEKYQGHFDKYSNQINEALSDAFEINGGALFNDLVANVSLNPVSPRFLQEHYFEVFYLNSEKGALGVSLHEVIHYFWFYVWNREYGDGYEEYEEPSLKWILSEMVVESIMSDKSLCSINPYYPREQGGCVYSYFQNMEIKGHNILDTLRDLYENNSIVPFMQKSHEYCIANEKCIREHILNWSK